MKRALIVGCTAVLLAWGIAAAQTRDETQANERTQTTVEEQTRTRVENPDVAKPAAGNQQGEHAVARKQDRIHKPDQGQGQQQGPQAEGNRGPQAQEQEKAGTAGGAGNQPNKGKSENTQAQKKTGPRDATGPIVGPRRDPGSHGSVGNRGGGRGRR